MNTSEQEQYEKARVHVNKMTKFYNKLTVYIVVISGLAAINYYENEWYPAWFLWVAFGWGIGIVFRALKTFQINPFFSKDWEDRKIKEYMAKENNSHLETKELERWE